MIKNKLFKSFILIINLLFILIIINCSGGTTAGGGGTTTANGETGPVISKETRENFDNVMKEYNNASKSGWTQDECREVADSFKEVSDEVDGGFAEALYNAGIALENCNITDDAKDMYERAMKANKSFSPPYIKLALFEFKMTNHGRAEELLKEAIKADRRSVEGYTNLAVIQRERGDVVEAQKNLRRALAVNSDYMPAFAQMALLYMDLAKQTPQLLDIALLVCQQSVARDAEYAPIYHIWGLANMRKGDIVEAAKMFEKAKTLDPDFFEAYMNFGSITLSFRGFEDAESAFKRAVELKPDNYEALIGYGTSLRGLERFNESEDVYEKAIKLSDSNPAAYFNIGILYQDYLPRSAGGNAPDEIMGNQIKLYQKAQGFYRQAVDKCSANTRLCKRPNIITGEEEDIRQLAQKRIENCNSVINGLNEAIDLQREAAKMQKEAAAQTPPPANKQAPADNSQGTKNQ